MALMFLNGEGMAGGSAHPHILGAPFRGEVRTAPRYRFLAFGRRFPGLLPAAAGGTAVLGELYDVPLDQLRELVHTEPPELELSVITLADSSASLGMVVRAGQESGPEVTDITALASWRAFLATAPG